MRCATWNALTLNNNAALPLLSKELNNLNINLAGLQETRLCDSGETLCDGFHYLWSGRTDGKHYAGVGLAMNTKLKKVLTSWKAISPRLLSARFLHQSGHLSVQSSCAMPQLRPLMTPLKINSTTNYWICPHCSSWHHRSCVFRPCQ